MARFMTCQVHEVTRNEILGADGATETITGTSIHPVWSVDRQVWVPLAELEEGETLQGSAGPAMVLSVSLSRVSQPVYNVEVHNEHVYQVGELGVLVHNTCFDDAPVNALTTYGKNALAHFRSHAQHIRETARKLGIEIPKSPSNPETLAAIKGFIDKVVNEGAKKTGKFKDVVDAEWHKLGDAIVVRRPNGEWLSFLDYSKKSPLSNLWDSM
jgi:hypothetical protein